jgi:hypothetical protein
MENIIENTSGFYKLDGDLLYAPNFVLGPYQQYELRKETQDQHEYPIDGWHWFDSEAKARTFFNIPQESNITE